MKRGLRLLITSAGRRGELLQCFRNDAAALGIELEIIACDLRPEWSQACRIADVRIAVPLVTEPDYHGAMLDIFCILEISLVVHSIQPELLTLRRSQHRIQTAETRRATWQ